MLASLPGGVGPESGRPQSIHTAAYHEALIHKWIESKLAGYDLGHSAIDDWYRRYWPGFCRFRRLEHLAGQQRWVEFAEHEFGKIHDPAVAGNVLLPELITRFERGWENLHFIGWVHDERKSQPEIDGVIDLLEIININDTRLEPKLFPFG